MSGEQTLPELLKAAVRDGTARVHTCMPATVVSYDLDTQTISARINIRSRYKDKDGTVHSIKGPVISNVPVMFPSGNGYAITFPLTAGDHVTIHVAERSLVEWKRGGGDDIEAADLRRFDLTDAFAYPGGLPPSDPLPSTAVAGGSLVISGDFIRLGSVNATDRVSLASKTNASLNSIINLLKTFTPPTGPGLKAAAIAGLSTAAVGATKVRAE